MKITCPHCDCQIDVVQEDQLLSCPSCGSRLHFLDETLLQSRDEHRIVAHFELIEQVGRGHFGDVWKARDVVLGRTVAVKVPRTRQLDHSTVQLFVREARAAAQLRHQNIVAVHEVFMDDQAVYIVSDFIQGVTLGEEMRTKRRTARESAELCATIAEALHYAHNNGVEAHRDVKPGNVMIDATGKPYVMDFGLAKLDSADFTMTVAGQLLGTPAYMSPEQAQGSSTDRHTDIYSLGVMLYELLTHKRPFTGDTKLLLHQIISEEPRAPRKIDQSVPRPLETICLKAMSKDPKRRYSTAAEFAADLRRFLNGEPILAKPVSPVERTWRWARRNPIVAGLSTAASVLVVVLGVVLFVMHEKSIAGTQIVELDTIPSGSRVVFVLYDDLNRPVIEDGEVVRFDAVSPVRERVPAGFYFVETVAPDGSFHQVYRTIPRPGSDEGIGGFNHDSWEVRSDGTIVLPPIVIPQTSDVIRDMTQLTGGTFTMGKVGMSNAPPNTQVVPGFLLDQIEVTNAAMRAAWPGTNSPALGPDNHPVTNIWFKEALHYAELVGKRVMSEAEYEYAATQKGTSALPWGDDTSRIVPGIFDIQPVGQPDFDRTQTDPPIFGLNSNAAEWTDSLQIPYLNADRLFTEDLKRDLQGSRVVRGGPRNEEEVARSSNEQSGVQYDPRWRTAAKITDRYSRVGVRCARSLKPRFLE